MITPAQLERLQELQDKVSDERANLSSFRASEAADLALTDDEKAEMAALYILDNVICPLVYQVLRTTNDRNGNSRRLTLTLQAEGLGTLVSVQANYCGNDYVPRGACTMPSVEITPGAFRTIVQQAKVENIYRH